VQSSVVTDAISGNRIHVFRDRMAAEEHAGAFRGWVLIGAERPLPVEASSAGDISFPAP
jgi:hypothetical protein